MRSGRAWIVVAIALVASGGVSSAAGLEIEPGEWEFETTTHNSMAPQPTTKTRRQCITESDADPLAAMTAGSKCTISDRTTSGNTLTWKMSCAGMGGASMQGEGRLTADGGSAEGQMTVRASFGDQTMEMKQTWKGKRLGDCS